MHAEVERCRGGDWWTLESGFPAQPGTGLVPDLVRQAGQHEARGVSFQLPVSLTGLPQGRALSQALTLETASGSLHETQPGPPPSEHVRSLRAPLTRARSRRERSCGHVRPCTHVRVYGRVQRCPELTLSRPSAFSPSPTSPPGPASTPQPRLLSPHHPSCRSKSRLRFSVAQCPQLTETLILSHPAAACRNATASHSGLSSTLARCQSCPPLLCKCAWRGCGLVLEGWGTHGAAAAWSLRPAAGQPVPLAPSPLLAVACWRLCAL